MWPVSTYLVNTFVVVTNDLPEGKEKKKDIQNGAVFGGR